MNFWVGLGTTKQMKACKYVVGGVEQSKKDKNEKIIPMSQWVGLGNAQQIRASSCVVRSGERSKKTPKMSVH